MGTKARKMLPLFLALVLAITIAGCGGGKITEEELIEKVTVASEGIETCQFDIDMGVRMSGKGGEETFDASLALGISGLTDIPNKKMKMEMNITDIALDLPEEAEIPESMGMEIYLIGKMAYLKADIPGLPAQWTKNEVPVGDLALQDLVKQQAELLEASEIEILGKEKVNGVDCWVVSMVPNIDKLVEILTQQPIMSQGMPGGLAPEEMPQGMMEGMMKGMLEEILGKAITNMSIKQWYAKDTFFPMKLEMQMTIEISSEDLPIPITVEEEFEIKMDMNLAMLAHGFNEPVSIRLPPEAENAPEMPMMPGVPMPK